MRKECHAASVRMHKAAWGGPERFPRSGAERGSVRGARRRAASSWSCGHRERQHGIVRMSRGVGGRRCGRNVPPGLADATGGTVRVAKNALVIVSRAAVDDRRPRLAPAVDGLRPPTTGVPDKAAARGPRRVGIRSGVGSRSMEAEPVLVSARDAGGRNSGRVEGRAKASLRASAGPRWPRRSWRGSLHAAEELQAVAGPMARIHADPPRGVASRSRERSRGGPRCVRCVRVSFMWSSLEWHHDMMVPPPAFAGDLSGGWRRERLTCR